MKALAACLAAACLLTAASASAAVPAAVDEMSFEVLLDDKRIGSHTFRIDRSDAGERVETEAAFDVKVLFVPVYSYRHSNTEVWRSGCLRQIRSQTDSNGDLYQVQGRELDRVFRVETRSQTQAYAADCLMSFAYWDQRMLSQQRLLNAQTGELVDVDIRPLGTQRLSLAGGEVEVDGYRIVSPSRTVDIKVFYRRSDGRWLSLESVLENGRVMRYVPASIDRLADAGSRGATPADVGK